MGNFFTNIFRKKGNGNCTSPDCQKFVDHLHLYIDGEANQKEEEFLKKHMNNCNPCLDAYHIEQNLLNTIRTKIEKKKCPDQVLQSIKDKINQESLSNK